MHNRRSFLQTVGLAAAATTLPSPMLKASSPHSHRALRVACQQYPWFTYFQREDKDWFANLDTSLKAFKASGLTGYEPAFNNLDDVSLWGPKMQAHQIWMESLYVNSTLHETSQVEASMESVLAIAKAAKPLGLKFLVTNPSPIRWGSPENKNDAQLKTQAQALNQLGAALRNIGVTLAYHNHDPEMRESAREFHHMMLRTDPENVALCLDSHWIYRGAGNSQVALFDIVKLYGSRIVELHLRQSQNGIWSETFGPGDIDHPKLVEELLAQGLRPHVVLEQAVEEGTPYTMDAIEAHRQSLAYVSEVFAPLGTQ